MRWDAINPNAQVGGANGDVVTTRRIDNRLRLTFTGIGDAGNSGYIAVN